MQRFLDWIGIDGEVLAIIGVVFVAVVAGLVGYVGVPEIDLPRPFRQEDIGARLRRECESIVREAHPEASASATEMRIRWCIEQRGQAGK